MSVGIHAARPSTEISRRSRGQTVLIVAGLAPRKRGCLSGTRRSQQPQISIDEMVDASVAVPGFPATPVWARARSGFSKGRVWRPAWKAAARKRSSKMCVAWQARHHRVNSGRIRSVTRRLAIPFGMGSVTTPAMASALSRRASRPGIPDALRAPAQLANRLDSILVG